MPALLIIHDKDGKRIGQCDAKCYDGTSLQCRCICGGINHGVGRQRAAKNAVDMSLRHCTPEQVAPRAKGLTLAKYHRLADLTHPTFWEVH